jgi:hypothetical protein
LKWISARKKVKTFARFLYSPWICTQLGVTPADTPLQIHILILEENVKINKRKTQKRELEVNVDVNSELLDQTRL